MDKLFATSSQQRLLKSLCAVALQRSRLPTVASLSSIAISLMTQSASIAAERIVFHYGLFSYSLPMADLERYAQDGTVSSRLSFVLNRIDPEQEWLRNLLLTSYVSSHDRTTNINRISRLLESDLGRLSLRHVGEVVQTESLEQNGDQALRAAVILATSNTDQPTVLEVLQQFPQPNLMVDVREVPDLLYKLRTLARLGAFPIVSDFFAQLPVDSNPRLEAEALMQEAFLAWMNGRFSRVINKLNESLSLRRQIGDTKGEAITLLALGLLYNTNGPAENAIEPTQKALAIFRDTGFREGEGLALGVLAWAYYANNQFSDALVHYQAALDTYEGRPQIEGQFTVSTFIELFYPERGELFSLDKIVKLIYDYLGQGIVYSMRSQVYRELGLYEKSLADLQEALAIYQRIGYRSQEATVLHGIGDSYHRLGQYDSALSYLEQSRQLSRAVDSNTREAALDALGIFVDGFPTTGEGWLGADIAEIYIKQGRHEEALSFFNSYLNQSSGNGSPYGEGIAYYNIGYIFEQQNQPYQALNQYWSALRIVLDYEASRAPSHAIGVQLHKAKILTRIGGIFDAQQQPEIAIAYYKQAVEAYEKVRQSNRTLTPELLEAYNATVGGTYRQLADLLLQQDRIIEAQQVLDLLKVQELDEYLRGVRGGNQPLTILQPERELLERLNELHNSAIILGEELRQLSQIDDRRLTAEQRRRINVLDDLYSQLSQQFAAFLSSEEIRSRIVQLQASTGGQTVNLSELARLQDDLERWNAAIIYPLILEDRLELVITTPQSPPLRRTVPIERTELNQAILALREALQSPLTDPTAPAQQLYDWLIRPLENDLADAGVDTLVYAPDGPLRYIPLAALHDGNQWLIQRYRVNNITALSLQEDGSSALGQEWSVLAGAFVNGSYSIAVGESTSSPRIFQGLPYAGREVELLSQTIPTTTTYLDQQFSLSAIKSRLDNYEIIHFATHAAFVPGSPDDSFILFGDGSISKLPEIAFWRLNNVDLVVLSACETGLGDSLGSGEEVLGLGYQFQRAGARSVIASLWQVSDGGTQELMTAFYTALQQGNLSQLEALQRAQLALIEGVGQSGNETRGGFEIPGQGETPNQGSEQLQHPYYWASFFLIGNGF